MWWRTFNNTIQFQTDGPELEKSPPVRKAPHGLERAMPYNTSDNSDQNSHSKNHSELCLSQCYFDVRHAINYVAVAEAYQLLQEMTE